ncbi:MAG: hypothetical protein WDN28_34040 [Chthoniobacter sp.]
MILSRHILAAILCFIGASTYADNPPIATPYIPTFQNVSGLGTTVVSDTWTNLSNTNHPGYPGISGSQAWPASLGPDTASGRLALLQKTPGFETDTTDFLPAASGGGIYSFFSNTHFEITSGVPLADANAIQLQVSMAEGATPADIVGGPTLTLTTTAGVFSLAPTSSSSPRRDARDHCRIWQYADDDQSGGIFLGRVRVRGDDQQLECRLGGGHALHHLRSAVIPGGSRADHFHVSRALRVGRAHSDEKPRAEIELREAGRGWRSRRRIPPG